MFTSGEISVGLYVGASTEPDRAVRKWAPLIDNLQELGADAVLLNAGVEYSDDEGFARGVVIDRDRGHPEVQGISVGSLRDFTGALENPHGIPTLNSQSAVNFARDKAIFYSFFPEHTARTLVINPGDMTAAIDFLHDLPGDSAVLKPAWGLGGKEAVIGTKASVAAEMSRMQDGQAMFLQEALSVDSMPEAIKPLTDRDEAALAEEDVSYVLRLFCSNHNMVPVLRRFPADEKKYYAYIDPDTVPVEAYDLGKLIVGRTLSLLNEPEIHGALDLAYDEVNKGWKVMELYVKEPALPKYDKNAGIANMVGANLARQLIRMAEVK